MRYQKPYIISSPKKPYIVPDAAGAPRLAQQIKKNAAKGGEAAGQKDSAVHKPWERDAELAPVYHNCPL